MGLGEIFKPSSSRPRNGSIDSTTAGSWSPSETFRQPKPNNAITPCWNNLPRRLILNQMASGEPGAFHPATCWRRLRFGRVARFVRRALATSPGAISQRDAALAVFDDFVAATTIEIQSVAARVAPVRMQLRRRIDGVVFQVRMAINVCVSKKARQASPMLTRPC